MYEIDFTGWVREPEVIAYLQHRPIARLEFHIRRVILAIKYKRGWYSFKSCFIDLLINNTSL